MHTACQFGRLDIASLLEPFPEDVMAVDRHGNTALHHACSAANYELCKLLAKRANMDVDAVLHALDDKTASTHRRILSKRQKSMNINIFRAVRIQRALQQQQLEATRTKGKAGHATVAASGVTLMQGYLKKRRETDRWLR